MLARYMLLSRVRLSVRLSATSRYRNDWTNRTAFWHADFLPPIPHCSVAVSKLGYLPKIRVLPSGTLSQTPYLEIRHDKSIALSTSLVVVVDGRVCWRHLFNNRRVVAVYYKSINCNPVNSMSRFVDLFLQLTRFCLPHPVALSSAVELLVCCARRLVTVGHANCRPKLRGRKRKAMSTDAKRGPLQLFSQGRI